MTTTVERVRRHRENLRARGLRPIQLWVPDVNAPQFVAELSRQARATSESDLVADEYGLIDDFIEAITADLWADQ